MDHHSGKRKKKSKSQRSSHASKKNTSMYELEPWRRQPSRSERFVTTVWLTMRKYRKWKHKS